MRQQSYRQPPTEICDEELLYRGVHPDHVKEDGSITSAAFLSRTNPEISVDRSAMSTAQETLLRRPSDVGVVELLAGEARQEHEMSLRHDPIIGHAEFPDNPAHTLMLYPANISKSQMKKGARKLAKAFSWIINP